ncbi:pentapeptide repeat-containing protein [Streptomyces sp. NPDC004051]
MDDGNTRDAKGASAPDLRGDCGECFGLCCVALPFTASADFAVDKQAGSPCRNLRADHRCGIHARLRQEGFSGCTVYDCFGAGQKVSQLTFGGQDWRTGPPERARRMFEVFPVVRQLHELLWYLTEALTLPAARPVHAELRRALEKTGRLTRGTPEELGALDVGAHRQDVNVLLLRASELARAGARGRRKDRRGADLMGARLKGADLRGVSLRGAYLIAADLTGADLRGADLIGADLRDTDLTDADLTGAFFLTQPQLNAARGSAGTKLPGSLTRPAHWTAAPSAAPGAATVPPAPA